MKELIILDLNISSSVFKANGFIPKKYACEGDNINPPLQISKLPKNSKSLAILVDDPDAPSKTFTHWVVWNITPGNIIEEDSIPGVQGTNDYDERGYSGPCPPSGIHRYVFKIFALDTVLELKPSSKKQNLEKAMKDHILAYGDLVGLYKK